MSSTSTATSKQMRSIPVLWGIKERRDSIMASTPAIFLVEDSQDIRAHPKPWYQICSLEEVSANRTRIEEMATWYKLDPDFVKAIVYIESTHGWYDRIDPWNKTIRPMNVHDTLWHQLGITRSDLMSSNLNIAAGVHILAAIWERTKDPTVERVATLYNELGATKVNVYGKTVAYYVLQKPWLRKS
jgi:hypothetical protein